MELPTLKELGLQDKRRRISDEVKKQIKAELQNGVHNMSYLSKKYGVSVCTVRMIRNPEHEKSLIKQSRARRYYYNKEKQKMWSKDLQNRKIQRIQEILKEYDELKKN